MYCATQARVHTTPPEEMAQLMQALSESASDPSQGSILSLPYNSSASAVCGIWLLFGIWWVVRAITFEILIADQLYQDIHFHAR